MTEPLAGISPRLVPLTCEPEPAVCGGPEPALAPKTEEPVERVLFCHRDADVGIGPIGLNPTHAQHHWLKTTTKEAGMGGEGKGVPGRGGSPDYPGMPTTINDHASELHGADTECVPLPKTDEQCVNDQLRFGQATGRWLPPFNDCHSVVAVIVEDCTPDEQARVEARSILAHDASPPHGSPVDEPRDERLLESKDIP